MARIVRGEWDSGPQGRMHFKRSEFASVALGAIDVPGYDRAAGKN